MGAVVWQPAKVAKGSTATHTIIASGNCIPKPMNVDVDGNHALAAENSGRQEKWKRLVTGGAERDKTIRPDNRVWRRKNPASNPDAGPWISDLE